MASEVKRRLRTNLETRLRLGAACRGPDHAYEPVGIKYVHHRRVGRFGVEKQVRCNKCGRVTWLPEDKE